MMNKWEMFKSMLAYAMVVIFGILLVYIFLTIEVFGVYGQESNAILRYIELFMGIPIIALGIDRLRKYIRTTR
jgi:hypothetical protein